MHVCLPSSTQACLPPEQPGRPVPSSASCPLCLCTCKLWACSDCSIQWQSQAPCCSSACSSGSGWCLCEPCAGGGRAVGEAGGTAPRGVAGTGRTCRLEEVGGGVVVARALAAHPTVVSRGQLPSSPLVDASMCKPTLSSAGSPPAHAHHTTVDICVHHILTPRDNTRLASRS